MQVQTGTENWYQKRMRGFNFVPIRYNPIENNPPIQTQG